MVTTNQLQFLREMKRGHMMKALTTIIMFFPLVLNMVTCGPSPNPWNKRLEDNTVYVLNKSIEKINKHLTEGHQLRKKGRTSKADVEIDLMKEDLKELEIFYLPLLNARAHVTTAYRLYFRKENKLTIEELNNAKTDIEVILFKSQGRRQSDLKSLIMHLENLEKLITILKSQKPEVFVQVVKDIDRLTGKTIKEK
jgi:hypothetical protein